MADTTLGALVTRRIAASPNGVAIRTRKTAGGPYQDVTWAELGARTERIAAGVLTALPDLADDAHIAILGTTSEDWVALDFACLRVGLPTVPVYATLLPDETGYLHVDTGCVITIVENAEQLAKIRELRKGFTFFDVTYKAEDVKIRHIVVMNPEGIEPADDWESLAALEARGAANLEATRADRDRRAAARQRNHTATYTYTSGTTGPPKAVIQTHHNHLSMIENIEQTHMFREEVREGGLFLFLPLAHSFGRLIEFSGPYYDCPLVIGGIPTLLADLQDARPGFIPAAPRVYEKMKSRIETTVASAPPLRQRLFKMAIDAGKATVPYRSKGQPLPMLVNLKYKIAHKVVLSKLQARLGMDRASVLLSGSAPLSVEVHEFFLALGLDLLEAYGLTETCPGLTGNRPNNFRLGTVGQALPGVTIKIAEDGEILGKGPNIFSGYLNRPDATGEAFDADGWFHTGDLGTMDAEGFVKITGRKKELMKTSGGKYIAPAKLEGRLKNHPLIQEAVTVADTRHYVTALIAIDPEELTAWSTRTGNPAQHDGDAVRSEIQEHVNQVNTSLASYESVKYFTLVPPMTVDGGLLTASLKVKRKVVYERYGAEIEVMYSKAKGGD